MRQMLNNLLDYLFGPLQPVQRMVIDTSVSPTKKFSLTHQQQARFKDWAKNQPRRPARLAGDMGMSPFRFTFQESNVGLCVSVLNEDTNEELDLTEYENF